MGANQSKPKQRKSSYSNARPISPYTHDNSNNKPIRHDRIPVALVEDNDDDKSLPNEQLLLLRRRLSIDFHSEGALPSSRDTSTPAPEFAPATSTLSSFASNNSSSSLATALFSTTSSSSALTAPSTVSLDSFSSSPNKVTAATTGPDDNDVMKRVLAAQALILQGAVEQGFNELERMALIENHVEAYYPLAVCYHRNLVPRQKNNKQIAFEYYRKAAKQGDALLRQTQHRHPSTLLLRYQVVHALYCAANMLLTGECGFTDSAKAHRLLLSAAKKGSAAAQIQVGKYYFYETKNLARAFDWLQEAVKQKDIKAKAVLGALMIDHAQELYEKKPSSIAAAAAAATSVEQVTQCGLEYLQEAADQGDKEALFKLAALYEQGGPFVRKDRRRAIEYYEKSLGKNHESAAASSDALTHYMVGITYLIGDQDVPQNVQLAIHHLTISANAGYARAQHELGALYADGIGVPKDEAKAHRLFKSAAAQGHVASYGRLGKQYETGRGCAKDLSEAIRCYERLAQHATLAHAVPGQMALALLLDRMRRYDKARVWFERVLHSSDSQHCLLVDPVLGAKHQNKLEEYRQVARFKIALYRQHGLAGFPRDPARAFREYLQLADDHHMIDACYAVAEGYRHGVRQDNHALIILPRNPAKAFIYYLQAAERGDKTCQFRVADMLSNGFEQDGVFYQDRVRAFEWYQKATAQGVVLAMHCLAIYYSQGLPPIQEPNLDEAKNLWRQAAKQGLPEAMVSLGKLLLQQQHQLDNQEEEKEAFHWLETVAATTSSKDNAAAALRELAMAYETGHGPGTTSQEERYQMAYQFLQLAAEQLQDPKAWFALARYHEKGWAVEPDLAQALACLTAAENLGYARASLAMAEMYEQNGLRDRAFAKYDQVARQENIQPSFRWHARLCKIRLAVLHDVGEEPNKANAYKSLCEMIQQATGDQRIDALELLGVCCEFGIGTSKDIAQAMRWYEQAVQHVKRHSPVHWAQERARSRLAKLCMLQGKDTEALMYLRQLEPQLDLMKSNQESAENMTLAREARYRLGYLLLHGRGIDKNVTEAKRWLEEAAGQGHGAASYELGLLALQNNDDREARYRLTQGDMLGHAGSKRELAMLLYRDQSFDQDWTGTETKDLLENASQMGDAQASVQLGLFQETGDLPAIPRNPERAILYYGLAVRQGQPLAAVYAGQLFDTLGRYHEAAQWFNKEPGHPISRIMLASYRIRGLIDRKSQAGLDELKRIVTQQEQELSNDDPRLRKVLGQAFVLLGEAAGDAIAEARQWYRRGESVGCAEATYRLGQLAHHVDNDDFAALEHYRRAVDFEKHPEAYYQISLFHQQGLAGLEPSPAVARTYIFRAADAGHPRALYERAKLLWQEQKLKSAFEDYKRAAAASATTTKTATPVPEAMRTLGHLYHRGHKGDDYSSTNNKKTIFILVQNYKHAFSYFEKAAALGDQESIVMLGSYYEHGYDPDHPVDLDKALACYKKAHALSDSPQLKLQIGQLLHKMAQYREAYSSWFLPAAAAADQLTAAKIMVALYQLNGWGNVPRDPERGFRTLLQLAQEEGDTSVLEHVARCYEQGIGVPEPSREKALRYWLYLANAGDKTGYENVRRYYEEGWATGKEVEHALRTFVSAPDDGSVAPSERDGASTLSSSSLYPSSISGEDEHI